MGAEDAFVQRLFNWERQLDVYSERRQKEDDDYD